MAQEWEDVAPVAKKDDGGWEEVGTASKTPYSSFIEQEATAPEETSVLTDIYEALKAGPTESATAVGLGASYPFALTGWMPMGEQATQAQAELPQKTQEEMRQSLFGYQTKPAQTTVGRYLGAGVRAAADPANLILGGATSIPKAALATRQGIVAGITGEFGGDIGAETEKALTGTESGVGRTVGTLGGALTTAAAAAPIKSLATGTADITGQIWNKYKNVAADPAAAETAVASGAAKRFLEQAATASGVDNVEKLVKEFKEASEYITQQEAPLFFAMAQNPVVKAEIIRQAKSNPVARASLQEEINKISQAIDKKAAKIFGSDQIGVVDVGIKATPIQKKIANIDTSIATLNKRIPEGADDAAISNAVSKLVEQKSTAVKQELSNKYEGLKAAAKQANVSLPQEATQGIYAFYRGNKVQDLFGVGTETSRKIGSLLKPVEVPNPNIDPNITALERGAGGQPATIEQYRELSFDDIDSMKRMINREQRATKDPAKLDKLRQFEEQLNNTREQYIPEWSDRLKALDQEYFERMGIPFRNAEAMKEIDSVKYASKVAPVILKNIDSYNQFITAVGDEGKKIAQDAMMSKAWNKVVKNDSISRPALANFIKTNKAILAQMPEVETLLKNTLVDESYLRGARAQLDQQARTVAKQNADNFLLKLDDSSYPALVNNLINSSSKRAAFMKNIKNLSPENAATVRSSMRSALANRALMSNQGAMNFLLDPKNKVAIETIIGPGYQKSLKNIAILSDQLKNVNLDNILTQVTQQQMDAIARVAPGLDIPYVASTARDRIASPIQKAVRLLSRINVAGTQRKYDEMMLELLTDPKGVEKLSKIATDMNFKINNPFNLKKIADAVLSSVPPSVYIGLKQEDRPEEEPPEIYTNE